MSEHYFQGDYTHPYHLSAGAVVINEKNEVCCHHFNDQILTGYWADEEINNFYILMRETVNPNETLEVALHRGLMEEFGIQANIIDFIGSIQGKFMHKNVTVEKTTIYFLCKLISQDIAKRDISDIEGKTHIEWRPIDFLISKMREQSKRFKRTDIDESDILERVRAFL